MPNEIRKFMDEDDEGFKLIDFPGDSERLHIQEKGFMEPSMCGEWMGGETLEEFQLDEEPSTSKWPSIGDGWRTWLRFILRPGPKDICHDCLDRFHRKKISEGIE